MSTVSTKPTEVLPLPARAIIEAIETAVRDCRLEGCRLVVGVSGGPDSVALLLGLVHARDELKLNLIIAHLDHGLRPESRADSAFVRRLGDARGVPVVVGQADLARSYGSATGIEAAARRARYAFFAETAREWSADAVLVGHTAEDQVETRLLHLTRGSGLRGLRGMSRDSVLVLGSGQSIRVIRPLLTCDHAAARVLCAEHGVVPLTDSTNGDLRLNRNRIRHEVTPILHQVNPRFDRALERLARIAADADDFVEAELDRRLSEVASADSERWEIDRPAWRALPRALKHALLRRACDAFVGWDVAADTWGDLVDTIDRAPAGTTRQLARGITLRIDYVRALIAREPGIVRRLGITPISLSGAGATRLAWDGSSSETGGPPGGAISARRWEIVVSRRERPCMARSDDSRHVDLDRATLGVASQLIVRPRRPGDRFAPVGMKGTRKIQDLLVDRHVPRAMRDSVPIVVRTDDRIVWIAGYGVDRRYRASEASGDVVCLELRETGGEE